MTVSISFLSLLDLLEECELRLLVSSCFGGRRGGGVGPLPVFVSAKSIDGLGSLSSESSLSYLMGRGLYMGGLWRLTLDILLEEDTEIGGCSSEVKGLKLGLSSR